MAWGQNENGQLGSGTYNSTSNVPVAVKNLTGVQAISAGGEFSLALLGNGTVQAWGNDSRGQLGSKSAEGEEERRPAATCRCRSAALSGVTAVAAGADHALALLGNGTVMAWGEDSFGELGNGTITAHDETPGAVTGLSGVTAIAAGGAGQRRAAGHGRRDDLGHEPPRHARQRRRQRLSAVPVPVVGLGKVASISAGGAHMLAYGEPIPVDHRRQPETRLDRGRHHRHDHRRQLHRRDRRQVRRGGREQLHGRIGDHDHRHRPRGHRHGRRHRHHPLGHEPDRRQRPLHLRAAAGRDQAVGQDGTGGGRHDRDDHRHRIHRRHRRQLRRRCRRPSFTVNSSTSITAISPASSGGLSDVRVTNADGVQRDHGQGPLQVHPVGDRGQPERRLGDRRRERDGDRQRLRARQRRPRSSSAKPPPRRSAARASRAAR